MAGQRIGYVRVSTFEQNAQRQLDEIPVDRLFIDQASGKDTKRPQLETMLGFVREGDTVVVHSMDRLARNLDDLRRLLQQLTRRAIRIESAEPVPVQIDGEAAGHRVRFITDPLPALMAARTPMLRDVNAIGFTQDVSPTQ